MADVPMRGKLHLLVGLITALLIVNLFLSVPLYAQEASVELGGSEEGQARVEFDDTITGARDGSFIITGNVVFTYEDLTIRADEMVLEASGEVAHFNKNVVVSTPDQEFTGERFVYDIPGGTSVLFAPRGTFEMDSVEGPVYYQGETLATASDRIILTNARFTTCGCERPGYYVAGTRMEIVPNHVLIIYNVRFVESGITLFYWPKLIIPLDESSRAPFQLPQIGHNALDGWFVKAAFPYAGIGAGGLLHLDWFQYKGIGAGVTHYTRDDASGMGQIYLYGLANRMTGTLDPEVGWAGRYSSEQWNAAWELGFSEEGWDFYRKQESKGSISLQNTRPDGQISLSGSVSRSKTPEKTTDRISGNFRATQQLFGRTRLLLSGDTLLRLGDQNERRLYGYRVDLSNNSGPITWSVVVDQRYHPDLAKENATGTPSWTSSGRKPEVVIGTRPDLSLFGTRIPLAFEVGYGMFGERRSGGTLEETRSTALAQLRTMTIPLGERLSLNVGGSARGYWYGDGSDRLVLTSSTAVTYRPNERLSLRGSYEFQDQQGETPFHFDRTTPYERVRGTIQYNGESLGLTVGSGYNLRTQLPENLTLSLNATPFANTKVRFQGEYSLAKQEPVSAAGTIELGSGEPFSVQLGGKYAFDRAEFDRVDAAVRLSLGTWKIGYEAIYDGKEDAFERGILTVLRDLDCRQIGLSYDQREGSVWVEYRITAIPTLGLRLGSEDQKMMFNLDGWEELFGE